MLLSLLLLAVLLGYRPIRRLLWIRHLKEPFWHVSPSLRVLQGWRLIEIALADAGVKARPGEPVQFLIQRALPVLAEMAPGIPEVAGLNDAARIRDRVQYGMGVGPDDVECMRRCSAQVYHSIWERLSDMAQYRAMYRGLTLTVGSRRAFSLYDEQGQAILQPRSVGPQILMTGLTAGIWLGVWVAFMARDIRRLSPDRPSLPGWRLALFCLVCANWYGLFVVGVGWWILSVLHRWRMVIAQTAVKRGMGSPTGEGWKTSLLGSFTCNTGSTKSLVTCKWMNGSGRIQPDNAPHL